MFRAPQSATFLGGGRMVIYLVTNKINGKQYVGQTIRPLSERWRDHCRLDRDNYFHRAIHKYGKENFDIEVIDTAENEDELDRKEIDWIQKLNTMIPNGYNLKSGGNVSMRGRYGGLNPKSRLIYQFTLNGGLVNGYWGISEASRITGITDTMIHRSLKANGNILAGGFLWMYADEFTPQMCAEKIDNYRGNKHSEVLCVETGERFGSMTEAAKKYNTYPCSISACCSGKLKTTAGYHWKKI
jgi:group I intron endonuclease